MSIKIAHLADIHIKNSRYHQNYKKIFESMFDQLRKDEVDLIFVLGDIAHTKINLSAEFFEMAHFFFSGLSEIAPVYSILGNHDANLANLARQDSVSPVLQAMKDNNIELLKYTGVYPVKGFPIDICHYSLFDTHKWPKEAFEVEDDRISICFYHGPLDGCVTDSGYKMDYKVNKSLFTSYDYTMLGDIHLCQPMDKDGRVWYAGSLIQQNFGESCDKGYLLWTIDGKNDWTIERRELYNPEPFVTVLIEDGQVDINHPNPPEGCRMRFIFKDDLSTKEIHDISQPLISKYKPKETRIKRSTSAIAKLDKIRGSEDYRSAAVQAELLREFCEARGVKQKIIKKVIELNNELCSSLNQKDEVLRNIIFDVEKISWENMFSYGGGNELNLEHSHGLVGIFGPNATGKSSVVDSLLFSMFNKVSRKVPSIGNIVNNKKKEAISSITLSSGNQKYHIDRKAVWKKVDGIDRGACSVYVDFYEKDGDNEFEQNNGKSRPDTDNSIIRPKIGEFEDYITTSVSPQGNVSRFLELGAADRKDYLIKILDIAFFDTQFEAAKERSRPLKSLISTLNSPIEIKNEIKELLIEASLHDKKSSELELELSDIFNEAKDIEDKISEQKSLIETAEQPEFNLEDLLINKSKNEKIILKLKEDLETDLKRFQKLNLSLKEKVPDAPDIQEIEKLEENIAQWNELEKNIKIMLDKHDALQKQAKLLNDVPCGDSFPSCPLISSAHVAKNELKALSSELESLAALMPSEEQKKTTRATVATLNEQRTSHLLIESKREKTQSEIKILNAEMSLNLERLEKENKIKEKIKEDIEKAERETELQQNLEKLNQTLDILKSTLKQLNERKRITEQTKDDSIKRSAKCSAKAEILQSQYSELKNALEQFEAYEHLIAGLSRNGIVQKVLEDMQDAINIEIHEILSEIVPFTVKFDLSDPSCKMYIEYPNSEKRYLELASGMEKMISSLAIRVALVQLSSLPKLSTFIIDESFGALDPENINAMGRMFESLRGKFKNIIIISHIDSIKDMVDQTITIEIDEDGYSKLVS